jgi:uroporphyrinogen decarboxylase
MRVSHRERALRALTFREADRVALDMGGLNVTSLHIRAEAKLKAALRLSPQPSVIGSFNQQAVIVDERILRHFGADFRVIYPRDGNGWAAASDGTVRDEYGIDYRLSPDGLYYDFARHPLADADLAGIERHAFSDPRSESRIAGLAKRIADFGGEYALVLEGARDTVFGVSTWLRGMEQFFMDLADESPLAEALLDKVTQHHIEVFDFILGRLGRHIDVVRIGDDLGSQSGLLISPHTYRTKVKPRHARLVRAIKERADCKVVMHSCGAIREILPDFIEIGIDGINPVQVSCAGLEPAGLKRDFGKQLVFWGGGVDTQQVLSKASPAEVRRVVRESLEIFKPGGGYVFAQVHNIQPDVPVENVLAMYEAFHAHAAYG